AVWIYGRTRGNGLAGRRLGAGFALAGITGALVLAATLATAAVPRAERDNLGYEPFSTARLDQLVAAHQPVFVNLTAAWCITCLVNEHTALASDPVRRAFDERHVARLKGDWTRQNPEITAFLQKFGRSGVPLYLLYDKAGAPAVLPQILTEASVLAALGKI
ncbi:MAG: thioredoxin family protein, partial [Stellaceae bacterium]